MTVPPEGIEVGKCYLTDGGIVRRVVAILPDRRIQYEWRGRLRLSWKSGILVAREFAQQAEREVPCDWTADTDEAG